MRAPTIPTPTVPTHRTASKATSFEILCRLLADADNALTAVSHCAADNVEIDHEALGKRLHDGFLVAPKYQLVRSQARVGVQSATERDAMLVLVVRLRETLVSHLSRPAARRPGKALVEIYRLAIDVELQLARARTAAAAAAQVAALGRVETAFRADLARILAAGADDAEERCATLAAHGNALNLMLDALQHHAATTPLAVQLGRDLVLDAQSARQTRLPRTAESASASATTIALLMRAHLRARRELDADALDSLAALPALRNNAFTAPAVRWNLIAPWVSTVCVQAQVARRAGVAAAACRAFRREGIHRLLVALSALRVRAQWLDEQSSADHSSSSSSPSSSSPSPPSDYRYQMSAERIATALAGHGDHCTLSEVLEPWMRAHGIASTPRHAELVADAALARAHSPE
jgi:hypothetical protein